MPLRTRILAAKVWKLSPPSKSWTYKLCTFGVQFANEEMNASSPITSGFSSDFAIIVSKLCGILMPPEPPHDPTHTSVRFVHSTFGSKQAAFSKKNE